MLESYAPIAGEVLHVGICGFLGRYLHYCLNRDWPGSAKQWLLSIPTWFALAAIGRGVAEIWELRTSAKTAAMILAAFGGVQILNAILNRVGDAIKWPGQK